ncbi:MAG TPA: DUF1553 domain-containing protein [Planctomycetota bacterium]
MLWLVCAGLLAVPFQDPAGALGASRAAPDFQRQIRPLLADRCFPCHGPDAGARKAGLRLDSFRAATADLGGYAALVPGDPAASELVLRITAEDPGDRMPPRKSGLSLATEEIALLERWVAAGAEYPEHWAFVPPAAAAPPPVADPDWARDPLDRFVLARLEASGLEPAAEADRPTWLRRATFALTGLPPSPAEIAAFLADPGADAHERVVARLLDSPHFGERMAQPWLDLARYADTYGYQSDVARRVWPYRDWVIQAYNENLPYDGFVRRQIAGDLLPGASRGDRLATAFQRLHRQTNEGGSVEEEMRVEYVADRVNTFSTAFLGLTVECARCHDHKFDPVSQLEYYRMASYFDDIDESGLYSHFTSATPTPALDLPAPEQEAALARARAAVAALEPGAADWVGSLRLEPLAPDAHWSFDARAENGYADSVDPARVAAAPAGVRAVEGRTGQAVAPDGDSGLRFPGVGEWRRSDAFALAFDLYLERPLERAVVLHRSRAWTDAASQGWQILIEDGRLSAALIHFWPGDAIAVQTAEALPLEQWLRVEVVYDGSSRAAGLRLRIDGEATATAIVRDHLTRAITGGDPGAPTLGERFRDRGLAGGRVDELTFYSAALPADPALRAARRARDDLLDAVPQIMTMAATPVPRATHVLQRGNYLQPGAEVRPGVPTALSGPESAVPADRLELAEWLLAPGNPLCARVEVDRLWRAVFGRGLVDTPEDFGRQGTPPDDPELLDTLAVEFRASGWDRKALLRRLVLSASFRQSSRADAARRRADPDNELWSRGPSFRLPAEMLRDAALAASGLLVPRIGGPSVMPYQPAGLWQEKSGQVYRADTGEGLYRRSLYTFWKRTSPPPAMRILDAAKRDVCVARRQSTNTPLQALVLWNDPQFGEAARVLAAAVLARQGDDDSRLDAVWLRLAGRSPIPAESRVLRELLAAQRQVFAAAPEQAAALLAVGAAPPTSDLDPAEHAAWTVVCSTLLATDAFVMLR